MTRPRPSRRLTSLLPALLLGACATATPPRPLSLEQEFEVDYSASFTGNLRQRAEAEAEVRDYGLPEGADPESPLVEIGTRLVSVDQEFGRQLFKGSFLVAGTISREEYIRQIDDLMKTEVNLITSPTLTVYPGRRADMSITNQISYVADFEIELASNMALADPIIDVIETGITLECKPTLIEATEDREAGIDLDLEVLLAEAPDKLLEHNFTIPGIDAHAVTVQLPVIHMQRLATHATLGPDRVLVIGPIFKQNSDEAMILFLHAKQVVNKLDDSFVAPEIQINSRVEKNPKVDN